jgi:hypothetical protein
MNKRLKLTIKYSLSSRGYLRNTEHYIKNCGNNNKESNMHMINEDERERSNIGIVDEYDQQQQ